MKKKNNYFKKIIRKIEKGLSKNKNKYYWKRKYYRLLREVNVQKQRNDLLAEDLRRTYAQSKKYKNLYQRFCIMLNLFVKEKEVEKVNQYYSTK